jgi:hypothetical protein
MRLPVGVVAVALLIPAGLPLAQTSRQAPSAAEAVAEARRNLAECEAMPKGTERPKICITVCTRAIDGIPKTKPNFVGQILESCRAGLRTAREEQLRIAQGIEQRKQQDTETQARYRTDSGSAAATASTPAGPSAPARASAPSAAAATAAPATPKSSSGLALRFDGAIDWNAYGNALTMHNVLTGDFEPYRRGSFGIRMFIHGYLERFEILCRAYLPPDAVTVVSIMEEVWTRGGIETGRSVVSRHELTMAPRFVNGYKNFPGELGAYAISGGIKDKNATKNVVEFIQKWRRDMDRFFEVEACQGATMLQLGENLARLTSNRKPIQDEPNALALLESIKVKVAPDVESRDVKAKQAKADAFWEAQRHIWGQPPQVVDVPGAPNEGGRLEITYAAVAPDFVVPVPAPTGRSVTITVKSPYARRVQWIKLAQGLARYTIAEHTSEQNTAYFKDQKALIDANAWIISCTYDSIGMTLQTFDYWYRAVPDVGDPARLKRALASHPLLRVRGARTDCPLVMPSV